MEQIFPKRVFPVENEKKLNITIEFSLFELLSVLNFNLNWQILTFGKNFLNKDISFREEKKWTSPLNCAYWS